MHCKLWLVQFMLLCSTKSPLLWNLRDPSPKSQTLLWASSIHITVLLNSKIYAEIRQVFLSYVTRMFRHASLILRWHKVACSYGQLIQYLVHGGELQIATSCASVLLHFASGYITLHSTPWWTLVKLNAVTPCNLVDHYQRFGGTCRLYLQGKRVGRRWEKMPLP
jgi:hypothetical protein